jgi:hypothetical protein
MGATTTVEIPAGHLATVSHPDDVLQLLESTAQAMPAAS